MYTSSCLGEPKETKGSVVACPIWFALVHSSLHPPQICLQHCCWCGQVCIGMQPLGMHFFLDKLSKDNSSESLALLQFSCFCSMNGSAQPLDCLVPYACLSLEYCHDYDSQGAMEQNDHIFE